MPKAQREAMAAKLPAIATVEGRALSPFNMCLVAAQFPAATLVGGFRQWRKAGRIVRKGEHGMSLWVPFRAKAEGADDAEQGGDVRFGMGTVFDVSQTEPVDMPLDPKGYAARVEQLEAEGLTRSDAQAAADVEFSQKAA